MLEEVKKELSVALAAAAKRTAHEIAALLEVPKNPSFGDLTLPCYKLKSELISNPEQIAKDIILNFKKPKSISKVELKGAYINFFLDKNYLASAGLAKILREKENFGAGEKKNIRLMIEGFGQPNTHKAFHIGHFRNICISDSLARMARFYGYDVITANYIGDIGMHVAKWLWFFTKFYKGDLPKKDVAKWLAEIYVNACKKFEKHEEYHEEVSKILRALEDGKDKKLLAIWKKTRKLSLSEFENIYKKIGIKTDVTFYESKLSKLGKALVTKLLKKGVAKLDHGAVIVDLSKYGLGIFVLLKSDGTALYSTRDLALAVQKFEKFKIDKSLYVVAAEQSHYFKQLFKTLELMGVAKAKACQHLGYGLVLIRGKKMASRAGEIEAFEEVWTKAKEKATSEVKRRNPTLSMQKIESVAEKVALAALKIAMLKQSLDKTIDFDVESVTSFEGETGPYLLYALVRAKNILKKVKKKINFKGTFILEHPSESALLKKLLEFKDLFAKAMEQYAPNIIANYAFDLAKVFSEFYENCPVAKAKGAVLQTRLALVCAFIYVLRRVFNLLGIEEVEQM
ncbi:MAG: arginine--tRNA ligase [Candidatus Nanoarchaeia archaeon]